MVRGRAARCAMWLLAFTLLALPAAIHAQTIGADGRPIQKRDHAKLKKAEWQEPGSGHTIEPHGTVTTIQFATVATTKLPPPEDLKDDLSMTVLITLDTSTGTEAPLKLSQRSGVLTLTFNEEDIVDHLIQPSAIDGTTATVRLEVTAKAAPLRKLKPVYHEQVEIWLPGNKKFRRALRWIWKPHGKHDE